MYLAIDQHRKQLTVNIRNEEGDVTLKRQVSTEWKKVRSFFVVLGRQAEREGGFMAIVEVCGFNDWLLQMLQEYGCREIVLIQPEGKSKKKTDRRDANALGGLLWLNRKRLIDGKRPSGMRRVMPPTRQETENRQITVLRSSLKDKHTAVVNAVRKVLRKHNLERECPTKGIQTKKAREWLEKLSLPEIDRLVTIFWQMLKNNRNYRVGGPPPLHRTIEHSTQTHRRRNELIEPCGRVDSPPVVRANPHGVGSTRGASWTQLRVERRR